MIPNNAISYAQFQLRGGARTLLLTVGCYALLIGLLAVGSSRLEPRSANSTLRGWLTAILALQAANLVVFGSSRIAAAVRADAGGAMIESHRLMPTSPAQAVLGYLTGASSQAIGLGVANVVVGAVIAAAIGVTLDRWFIANGLLLVFAVFVWSAVAAGAFVSKGAFGVVLFFVGAVVFSQGIATVILPAFTLLIHPLLSEAVFPMRGSLSHTHAMAVAAQGVLALIFFLAACRRYERSDRPAMGVVLGLAFVAVAVAMSIIGMRFWEDLAPRFMRNDGPEPSVQYVAAAAFLMLLSLTPLANACRSWESCGNARASAIRPLAVALTAVALIVLLGFAPELSYITQLELAGVTACTAICYLLSTSYLLRWVYLAFPRAIVVGAIWTIGFWLLPILIDFAESALSGRANEFAMGWISAISPIGLLAILLRDPNFSPSEFGDPTTAIALGLAGQVAAVIAMAGLYHVAKARQSRSSESTPKAVTSGPSV